MNLQLLRSGILLTGMAGIFSCGSPQSPNQQAVRAIPVSTDTARAEFITGTDTYPGTVVALNEVELRGEVGGYITGIFVKDGQKVQKGQKLYEIDRSRYDAAFRQAQANVKIAGANLEKAKKDAERYQKLADQDAIAKQRVDYALTDLANAESQLAGTEAVLANATADLKKSVIIAPFSGTIGISQVKLGALVSSGQTLLNTISTDDPIAVDILIPQQEIPRFLELQKSSTAGDSVFTVLLSGNNPVSSSGRIVTIDRAVDTQTGTIKVRISYPNSTGNLIVGMNCSVRVLNRYPEEQVIIPYKAVAEQLGAFTVFVVDDSSHVDQRTVKTGLKISDKIVISEGLKAGEIYVTDGIQNLRHGALIQATNTVQAPKQ